LGDSWIEELPAGLRVDGYLTVLGSRITHVPEDLKVGRCLFVDSKQLPEEFQGDNFDQESTSSAFAARFPGVSNWFRV
jgi:hypothetical protein